MQTWYNEDWHEPLLTAWILTNSSQLTDWNFRSQLAYYKSYSSQLENGCGRISQTRNLLIVFHNQLLIKIAPRHCFGVTLANINRQSIMISYNWELNDWMSIILQIWENFYVISLQVLTKKNTRSVYQDPRI